MFTNYKQILNNYKKSDLKKTISFILKKYQCPPYKYIERKGVNG